MNDKIDMYGTLFNLPEKDIIHNKLYRLKELIDCKKIRENTVDIESDFYMITDSEGFYTVDSIIFLVKVEITESRPYTNGKITKIINKEEITLDALVILLSLNNKLKESADIVISELDETEKNLIKNYEKKGIYYEFSFNERGKLKVYLEFKSQGYSIDIDTVYNDINLYLPGLKDSVNYNAFSIDKDIANDVLLLGINFMEKHSLQRLENGVVVDNKYYETLTDAIEYLRDTGAL